MIREPSLRETSIALNWGGEELTLMQERAIGWRKEATLFVADPHLGKAASFRRAGIPVPEGPHLEDLVRLGGLVRATGAQRLVLLGDLIHSRSGRTPSTLGAFSDWRRAWKGLEIVLVVGNHDRASGALPEQWCIESAEPPHRVGPFWCCHAPSECGKPYTLAGHVHPMTPRLEGTWGGVGTVCYHFTPALGVLPAFGSFCGGRRVVAAEGDRVFAVGKNRVLEVTRLVTRKRSPGLRDACS